MTRRQRVDRLTCMACAALSSCAMAMDDASTVPVEASSAGLTTGVDVGDRGQVDLHVEDMPLSTVLRMLSIQGRRNIVASPEVKGTVTANLYGVTFEEALHAVLTPNNAGFRQSGSFLHVYSNEELAKQGNKPGAPRTRVFPLSYITSADAKSYIGALVGETGTIIASPAADSGLETESSKTGGASHASGDFVVVTAAPDALVEVERLLRELDVRPKQVLVEATILRAELNDENALGIDFTVVGGVDLELLGSASDAITNIRPGALPTDRFELFNSNTSTGFSNDVPNGGLNIGVIKDHVAVFLRALEQVTDTTVLANPKVLALNKQKGYVIVGRRDGYLTTTVTETQAVQTVEFLETGTQLVFRPFVGNDGFIRVELHPEDSVGFVNAQGLPSKQTTEVTTNVIVRDGDTILIGGLFREVTTNTTRQVPGVGGLPGVGALFRSRNDSIRREEVLILLTLHIVKDHDAFAHAAREQFDRMERIRVGTRRGLMWFGRDRLVDRYYRKAMEERSRNDDRRALWHVRLALNIDPRYEPALRLREELRRSVDWSHPGGVGGRRFVHDIIMQEHGAGISFRDAPLGDGASPRRQEP